MYPQLNQQEDPMEILRRAQEALRGEDDKRNELIAQLRERARMEQMQSAQQQALQQAQTPIQAPAERPENTALQQLMQRLAVKTPLDEMAQKTPQQLAKDMKNAALPKNKALRAILTPFAVMGGGGLESQYAQPAMRQFMALQEQYRKDRGTDLTAASQAAKIISGDQTNDSRLGVAVGKANAETGVKVYKAITDAFGQEAKARLSDATIKRLGDMTENDRNKYLLDVRKQTENIPENQLMGRAAAMLQQGDTAGAELFLAAGTEAAKLRAAAKSQQGSTSTSTFSGGVSPVSTVDANGNAQITMVQKPPTTSTRVTPRSPQADYLEGRKGLADMLGVSNPRAAGPEVQAKPQPAPTVSAEQIQRANSPTVPKSIGTKSGYVPVQAIPMTPATGGQTINLGSPKTVVDRDKANAEREAMVTVNDLFNTVLDAGATGVVDKVHGVNNNLVAGAERARGVVRDVMGAFSKASAYETSQKEWNALSNKYKDDPKALRYFQSFSNLNTQALANYIKKISGAQSAAEEAGRLSSLFPKVSDSPNQVLEKVVELQLNLAVLDRIDKLGLSTEDVVKTGAARKQLLDEKKTQILDNIKKARLLSTSGADYKNLLPGAEMMDINRVLRDAAEKSGHRYNSVTFRDGSGPLSSQDELLIKGGKPGMIPETSRPAATRSYIEKLLEEQNKKKKK
jgi:hypothetical protein